MIDDDFDPTTIIEFDSRRRFPKKYKDAVLTSRWVQEKIAERQPDFETSKILVGGIWFLPNGDLFKVDARVTYKNPDNDKETGRTITLRPDATPPILLTFRISGRQTTGNLEDYHVVMVGQHSWTANKLNVVEFPIGVLSDDERMHPDKLKGAIREFFEEIGDELAARLKSRVAETAPISLGGPIVHNREDPEQLRPRYIILDVEQEELDDMKEKIEGKFGGIDSEGERTRPLILRGDEALNVMASNGDLGWSITMLLRFEREMKAQLQTARL